MTKEETKIKRLEKQVKDLKDIVKELEQSERKLNQDLLWERQWRIDFQKLMKDAVQTDTLDDREYW